MSAGTGRFDLVITTQGAWAIRDGETGEVMHPVVGPIEEARTLYVEPSQIVSRLREESEVSLRLLDVGLGAGSNAIAAIEAARTVPGRRLEIVSFDRTLGALALAYEHAERFAMSEVTTACVHEVLDSGRSEHESMKWSVVVGELPETLDSVPGEWADVVFWDPFSPKANPQLWTVAAFARVRRACRNGATLHTYSGATAVRSALALGGFAVGEGPATHAARTSTIAAVDHTSLHRPLGARWLARLARSSAGFPTDAPDDAQQRIAAMPQFVGET